MNRTTVFFLTILAPLLALGLAWLGWLALKTNLLGRLLLVAGGGFALGVLVRYWILRQRYWNPPSTNEFTSEEKGDRSFWMIIPGMGLAIFLSPLEYLAFTGVLPRSPAMQYAGFGLVILSWLLFGEARRMIRASYSGHLGVTENQKLVQAGPYHVVRHPAYLSFILMSLGISVGFSSLAGLLALLVLLIPGMVYRIRVEDRLLEKHFGEEWRRYAAKTRRLVPGVW